MTPCKQKNTFKLGIKYKSIVYKTESKGGNRRSLMLTQGMREGKRKGATKQYRISYAWWNEMNADAERRCARTNCHEG